MPTQTVQAASSRLASRSVLSAKRQGQPYEATFQVGPDMPLELRTLGKDLVAQLTGAIPAEKVVDGRYVDLIGPQFEKIRVFTRSLRRYSQGILTTVAGAELSCINFAGLRDKPDLIYLVVFNSVTNKVDVFRFPPKDPSTKEFKLSYSLRFSLKTFSYSSKENFKVASYSV